jgi:hypothetical protein
MNGQALPDEVLNSVPYDIVHDTLQIAPDLPPGPHPPKPDPPTPDPPPQEQNGKQIVSSEIVLETVDEILITPE